MELPTQKIPASRRDPGNLVIYGPPKIGKTSILAGLENCLIIDLEEGSDMVDALKIKVKNLNELKELAKEIIKQGKPYKYIAIDTVTQLEIWCERDATAAYKSSAIGKNFDKDGQGLSVLSLPNGAGYQWLRQSYEKWIGVLNQLAPHLILVGHLKTKVLDKEGKEVSVGDLSLTGKIREMTCANADAIGYVFRQKDQTMISFDSQNDVIVGSRCEHLKGQIIPFEWDKIFID